MERPVHEMTFKGTTDSGREAWVCPECGRTMLIVMSPSAFSKEVVYPGDEYVIHTGQRGAVRMSVNVNGAEVVPDISTTVPDTELLWLNANGIKWE